jgi:hypothetical protein
MAIVKPLTESDILDQEDGMEDDIEVSVEEAEGSEDEDGNVIIAFGEVEDEEVEISHEDNLAEILEENELQSLASELIQDFLSDRESRKDWATAYMRGLDLLGLKIEDRSQPWQGASGVFHPMLTESVVRFQAQAMSEMMPASGPVRTKIVGKLTREKTEQAMRVETEMNYLITEEMTEYRDEMEQMFFQLPLAGSAFKKIYYDPLMERPVAMFVPAEDFVVQYGASNLATCPRYTHVMKKTDNEIRQLQVNGFYRDEELPEAERDITDIEQKYDDLDGTHEVMDDDPRHLILEMHVDLDLPEPFDDPDGISRPYVVTIDKSSRTILAIRRNWYEDDEKMKKRLHFVHYPYLPGLGFYGTGLIHLIGGLAKSATSILRQLIDAGTLSNLPAGLKAVACVLKAITRH